MRHRHRPSIRQTPAVLQGCDLAQRFPPSPPCNCAVCRSYCLRPGWWTVSEAAKAFQRGYSRRMMLELAPDRLFGVLSPAFCGCEGGFALQEFSGRGCNFLRKGLCELHGTGFQPLECRFCHHDRTGLGLECHTHLEADWQSTAGHALVSRWCKQMGLIPSLRLLGLERLL